LSELPFWFLVKLIGCAPDAVSIAMQKSVYVKLPGILWNKIGMKRVEKAKPVPAVEKAAPTRMKALTKSVCLASIPTRIRKALDGAGGFGATYEGPTIPITPTSDMAAHPSTSAPITWDYDYPEQVGGWIGGIEPENEEWIAFVDVLGHCLLWTTRDPKGGVVGTPYSFDRPDLAVLDHTIESVEARH